MGSGARRSVDVLTARALRVALDRSRPCADAAAALLPACHGSRTAACGALDRLERTLRSHPDEVIERAVDALRAAVEQLPERTVASRQQLHLVAPPA